MNSQEHTVSAMKATTNGRGSVNTARARFESTTLDSRIQRLVERGRVPEARAIAAGSPAWNRLLARPDLTITPRSPRPDFVRNLAWVEAHREQFLGKWVALRDGGLVRSDESFRQLRAALERDDLLWSVLVALVR